MNIVTFCASVALAIALFSVGFLTGDHFGPSAGLWHTRYEAAQTGWDHALSIGESLRDTTKRANATTEGCLVELAKLVRR